ncbi:MAG: phosphonate degradation HD-domain oxygenase [Alphaproteobacteria bacterium]
MESIDDLFDVLERAGGAQYGQEAVTQLAHALQCAQLAEQEGAPPATILAALLHDVGHLIHEHGDDAALRGIDDRHEASGAALLGRWFDADVTEPIRLHVDAKRWLCRSEAGYFDILSPASVRSLNLQGGVFDEAGADAFIAQPYAQAAVAVRRWDDIGKVPGLETPPLGHYRHYAEMVKRPG